jgi:very-short-patch-repair endonuclease
VARKSDNRGRHQHLSKLARAQHGVLTRGQLQRVGLSPGGIDARVAAGQLVRVHQGVYAMGPSSLGQEGRWLAAILACGPQAVLSHLDAAALWSLLPSQTGAVHVTVHAGTGRRKRPGIEVHRCRLHRAETVTREGIRVTSATRTLLDIAPSLDRRQLERALDEAFFQNRVNLNTLTAALARNAHRPGVAVLRHCLQRHEPGTTRTESELEERMLRLCRRHRVPQPVCQVKIQGYRVDFYWAGQRLIVETDGWQGHGQRPAFGDDRKRDVTLHVAGYEVLRFTHDQVTHEAAWVAQSLKAKLAR